MRIKLSMRSENEVESGEFDSDLKKWFRFFYRYDIKGENLVETLGR